MGTAAAGEVGDGSLKGSSSRSVGSVSSLLFILLAAQVALVAGLYFQTYELRMAEEEKQAQISFLKEQVDAVHDFFRSEVSKMSRENCPPCPSLQDKMEAALRDVHEDFEKTAEKLSANVNSLHATINLHAKKFASLAEKAQKSPLMKFLQNM